MPNEHEQREINYKVETRLRALEEAADIEPNAGHKITLPVVRKFKSDAISQEDLNKKEAELEAYWKGQNKSFRDQALSDLKAEGDRRAEEMKAAVAIAVAAALKEAKAAPGPEDSKPKGNGK